MPQNKLESKPVIDIGIVIATSPESTQLVLPSPTIASLKALLVQWLPELNWRIRVVNRTTHHALYNRGGRVEPVVLLGMAADLRDQFHWDFVLVLTNATLMSRYKHDAIAALSRPLDAAVISVAQLQGSAPELSRNDTQTKDSQPAPPQKPLADRITILMLHALGHLGGLASSKDRDSFLHHPIEVDELDDMNSFTSAELKTLRSTFEAVADTRLEEQNFVEHKPWRFAIKAMYINRAEIVDAVLAARAWEFPRRLSRLTTAAVSTLTILILTAEVWDLALEQSWSNIAILALMALLLTTTFVVGKQQLLHRHRRATEQLVVTRVSAFLTVVLGLIATWLGALLLGTMATNLLFSPELIRAWTMSENIQSNSHPIMVHLLMNAFCASFALLIGALGASFEEQHHFQHVIFVDEEL